MGRRTTIFDHRAVAAVLRGWGLSPWELAQSTPRCYHYWKARFDGGTGITLEDLGYLSEATGRDIGEAARQLWAAVDAANPQRIKGTLIAMRHSDAGGTGCDTE